MKTISINEFQEEGYLQEINRQFLHPLGLSLQIKIDPATREKKLYSILDCRDDPTGITFDPVLLSVTKARKIEEEFNAKTQERLDQFGYVIQPIGE